MAFKFTFHIHMHVPDFRNTNWPKSRCMNSNPTGSKPTKLSIHIMLKVAGATKLVMGKLGPLFQKLMIRGRFYKPLQDDDRGCRKRLLFTPPSRRILGSQKHIRRLFPCFSWDSTLKRRLTGLACGRTLYWRMLFQLSVRIHRLWISKIGSRTWYPETSEDYSPSGAFRKIGKLVVCLWVLGFLGCRFMEMKNLDFGKPERKLVQNLSAADVRVVLKKFVSSDLPVDPNSDPDCSLAGKPGLRPNHEPFEFCVQFSWCNEKEKLLKVERNAEVKLICFAPVTEGKGIMDHNFLGWALLPYKVPSRRFLPDPMSAQPKLFCGDL
ncbi:LOW QUALITY PROTEIN: hypothetical protein NC651_034558 [Populus alba x Populus x berolinensis]|nr:LOW QUALITY PROTEIN: hypothetical protein NC651_034558 [Populus alba x Populus x berolinensis]